MHSRVLRLAKEQYCDIFKIYISETFINKITAENITHKTHIFNNYPLPILGFFSDGGINMLSDRPDMSAFEIENSNYNNIFYANVYNPMFRIYNNRNINVFAGIPYSLNSENYYREVKAFKFKQSYIEQYKDINQNLFKILKANNIELPDFFIAFFLYQFIPIMKNKTFHLDDNDRYYDFHKIFNNSPFFLKQNFYDFIYEDIHKLPLLQESLFLDFEESNIHFLIRSVKFINSRFRREFVIFVCDENFEEISKYQNFNLNEISSYKNLLTTNMENILINERDRLLQYDLSGKYFNFIEFRIDKYNSTKMKPLLYVRTLDKEINFFNIDIHQHFLSRWLLIKYIKNDELNEYSENKEGDDETDYEDLEQSLEDNLDSWANPDLPKMMFYGSVFNIE
jgi:hypothetical protein